MQPSDERAAVSVGGWDIVLTDARDREALLHAIEDVLELKLIPPGWSRLAGSENAEVWKFPAGGRWCVFKRYRSRGMLDDLKALFRNSRAERAWASGSVLAREGIPTPPALAVGKKYFPPVSYQSFLITEFVPEAQGLYTFISEFLAGPLDSGKVALKRSILRSLGCFIGRLHARGIMHGDLRLDNILITVGQSGAVEFLLIDNERNRQFSKELPDRYRMRNLVQLNMVVLPQITFTDRLRFFAAYLEETSLLRPVAKDWIRTVFLKTRKRLQKKMPGIWER